jgi:hypothetical protein
LARLQLIHPLFALQALAINRSEQLQRMSGMWTATSAY